MSEHDDLIKYYTSEVYKEYYDRILSDKAFVKHNLEYVIDGEFGRKIRGECDFVFMDYEARTTYIVEVKHDYNSKTRHKAMHQLIKDMWFMYTLYNWVDQNGYMSWYKPNRNGQKLIYDVNASKLHHDLNKGLRDRIKEYDAFFNELVCKNNKR